MNNNLYPCLWFDNNAQEAAAFYCSIFSQSKITADSSIVVTFESHGQKFMCLNGGPQFKPNSSISFFVVCETQEETDTYWKKLAEGGRVLMPLATYDWSEQYGWVQDKFGINWQVSLGKLSDVGQKFTPSLMFTNTQHGKAEEAVHFYTRVFQNSSIVGIVKYGAQETEPDGTVNHAQFKLGKHVFMAMDSSLSHDAIFNEAISFVVECETQEEIDYYWNTFTADGGEESMCGWLKDKYGVSWQIVPTILGKLMSDPERGGRVVQAFLKMRKFDIETLLKA